MSLHVLSIVGARPQFIKAAVVSAALKQKGILETIVHTGQHYDKKMSDIFFDELKISPPTYSLGIGNLPHGAMTGRMIEAIEQLLLKISIDWVLVYGDTNSTLAGALAAAKCQIPVVHVEAGMRSFNRAQPEEINRLLTDHLSSLLFVTSPQAAIWLKQEGITQGVYQVGDVMYDAVLLYRNVAKRMSIRSSLHTSGNYGVVTLHRPINTDNRENLLAIWNTLGHVSKELPLVFPIHPRTMRALQCFHIPFDNYQGIELIPPVSYLEMLDIVSHSRLVLTDSGGLQKEAFYLGIPCVTLRDQTEWVETVEMGWNRIVGADAQTIMDAIHAFMTDSLPPRNTTVYGDGTASLKIAEQLKLSSINISL